MNVKDILEQLGISGHNRPVSTGVHTSGDPQYQPLASFSPVDGQLIARIGTASSDDYEHVIQNAQAAARQWALVPAPARGDVVRKIGNKLRTARQELGMLVSWEMGKSLQEGLGEVQEMIDICDFAVGLSRQLYGLTMHSERPGHRMYEQWHPLGVAGIITAFNFPVAVWAWNAMVASVCGDVTIWKPSEKTPLTALACANLIRDVLRESAVPEGTFSLMIGHAMPLGERLVADRRVPLISATGSCRMGKKVGELVASRLGRVILELGGNNAIILSPHAQLEQAIPAIVFGAVGTAGQRCTSTRRLIVHESIYERVRSSLVSAYQKLRIGNPLDEANHMGPLIDQSAVRQMMQALEEARKQGGRILTGGRPLEGCGYESSCYVEPAIVEADSSLAIVQEETFAPVLYLSSYQGDVANAISIQNQVRQGLSSAIFTTNLLEAEEFLSVAGSDCGIANVNIGTSGAEIGGAFGGEKETGGGRESGSDAWKGYMRRQTNTINYSSKLPLAQGIRFEI
ncbi:MAG: aldehyde dehydrogenase family protein [Deltaproteobacteria bacterium]|nr:aldehyde dehydrogenase family protein [Deltaproteobacteria bacterium]